MDNTALALILSIAIALIVGTIGILAVLISDRIERRKFDRDADKKSKQLTNKLYYDIVKNKKDKTK